MKNGEYYDAHFWRINLNEELPIYPFCSEAVIRREPRRTEWTSHPFLILCGLSGGSLRYVFNDRKIVLQEQDIIMIPPRTCYFFESYSTGGYYEKKVLELQGTLLDDLVMSLKLNQVCCWQKELWQDFQTAFEVIHPANEQSKLDDIPDTAAAAVRLLHLCALRNGQKNEKSDPRLSEACRWIENHLDIPIDLELLRNDLNISRASLGRLFHEGKGMSPGRYWCLRRSETAEFLLLHSDFSIKEIAFRLGYSSQFHFSNEFSRNHKLSPMQYRKRGIW